MTSETRYMQNLKTTVNNKNVADAYSIVTGSLNSGNASNLSASDDSYLVINAALVGIDRVMSIIFSGSALTGHLPFLQGLIEWKSSVAIAGDSVIIQAYDYDAAAYVSSGTMYLATNSPSSDVTKYIYSILSNKPFVDNTGNWKIKVTITRPATGSPPGDPGVFTVSFDYVYLWSVAYDFTTISPTGTVAGDDENDDGMLYGIRVWRVNSDQTETEITAGSSVATVYGPGETSEVDNTYVPGETLNCVAIIVRVYRVGVIMDPAPLSSGGIPFVFITEDLNTTLANVTWTVHYSFAYYAILDETYFQFGSSVRLSRITNFSYGVPVGVEHIGDGLTFYDA